MSTRFSLSMENEQADAGWDGRIRLGRTNSQAQTGTLGNTGMHFLCSADHEQDCQPYPVDLYSAICDDYAYIQYCTYLHNRHAGTPKHRQNTHK